jgi:bacillithiol system protein YtxJ
MGLFSTKEENSNNVNKLGWNDLITLSQLNEIEQNSHSKPVLIFKHSTRCSISRMALKQFESDYSIAIDKIELFFLDLLEHRDISNAIAQTFLVQHESPQLLLIKAGKCVYHVSHSDIDAEKVKGLV